MASPTSSKEATTSEQRPWHQYFGLSWMDFFRGTSATVEAEKDLSHKQQLLDLLISLPAGAAPPRRMPDGFDNLGRYNLVTFKSYQEALDGFAMDEFVGHFANCRKQISPSMKRLLSLDEFRLYAVSVRSPHELARETNLQRVQPGVYQARSFSKDIRVVVVHELPRQEHNAMLLLFSAQRELVEYGARHYQPHSPETSTLLLRLIAQYRQEGLTMPETLEEFAQRTMKEMLKEMPVAERLEGLSSEERLEGLSSEERLEGLSPEQRMKGLSLDDRLKGLSAEEWEALLQRMRQNGSQSPQE